MKVFCKETCNGYSSKTRVLLCQPWDYGDEGRLDLKRYLAHRMNLMNYGLVLLATLADRAGYPVKVFDAESELVMRGNGDPDYILDYRIPELIKTFKPDIVGISCFSWRWPEAYRMCEAFNRQRKRGRQFKLILGGFHPTSQTDEVFRQAPFIDWVHVGASERSFLEVLGGKNYKTIKGVAWKENGILMSSSPEALDLDTLPFPDWSWLNLAYYLHPNEVYAPWVLSFLPLLSTRGCIFKCAFCTYKHQQYQKHSPEYIGDYIEQCMHDYDANAFYPYDACLFGEYLHQICELIIKRGFHARMSWGCALRTDATKREDILLLKKANCHMTYYGFESGSDRLLAKMRKGATVRDGLTAAQYNHEIRLPFEALMIFGYPGETQEDVRLSQWFLEQIKPYRVAFSVFNPMPGSSIFDELKAAGKVTITEPFDYRKYTNYAEFGRCPNFTAMDEVSYREAYDQLIATSLRVSLSTQHEWAVARYVEELQAAGDFAGQWQPESEKAVRCKRILVCRKLGINPALANHGINVFNQKNLSGASPAVGAALLRSEQIINKYWRRTFLRKLPVFLLDFAAYIVMKLPQGLRNRLMQQ